MIRRLPCMPVLAEPDRSFVPTRTGYEHQQFDSDMRAQRDAGSVKEIDGYDTATVECYRHRKEMLSRTRRTEWWMAVAVLFIIASVGFVVL